MNNVRITIANTLSIANDDFANIGLDITVDHPLYDRLAPLLPAINDTILEAATDAGVELVTTFDDDAFEPADILSYAYAPDDETPRVVIGADTTTNDALFTNDTITPAQFDWLAMLIPDQLGLILSNLGCTDLEVRVPYLARLS